MFIYIQDEHPGRCPNFRTDMGDPYKVQQKRCLGPADEPHMCAFEPDTVDTGMFQFHTYKPTPPQKWVVPEGFEGKLSTEI